MSGDNPATGAEHETEWASVGEMLEPLEPMPPEPPPTRRSSWRGSLSQRPPLGDDEVTAYREAQTRAQDMLSKAMMEALTHPREFSSGTAALEWEAAHAPTERTPPLGDDEVTALIERLRKLARHYPLAALTILQATYTLARSEAERDALPEKIAQAIDSAPEQDGDADNQILDAYAEGYNDARDDFARIARSFAREPEASSGSRADDRPTLRSSSAATPGEDR